MALVALFVLIFFDLSAKDKNTTTYYVNASVERRDPRYPTLRGVGAKGAEVLCITPTDTVKKIYENIPLEFPDIPKGTEVTFRATYDGYEPVEKKWVTNEYRMNVLLLFTKEK